MACSRGRYFALCAAALCWLGAAASAQMRIGADELSLHAAPYSPSAAGTIRTEVELVEVPAVVRDSKGTAVPGLRREDFEVFDEGKKQKISAFSVETLSRPAAAVETGLGAPSGKATPQAKPETPKRYVALVLDDLNTDFASLRRGKTAAEKFVAEGLAPGDMVGVFTTALSQSVRFTADVPALGAAIEAVTPHARYSDDLYTCPVIRAYEAYLIANHLDNELLKAKAAEMARCAHMSNMDSAMRATESKAEAIWENVRNNTGDTLRSIASIVGAMGAMPGQRLVLLTTGGFVSGGEEAELQRLTTAALHGGVVISALDLRGLYVLIPGGDAGTPKWARGMHPADIQVQARVEDAKDDGLAVLATGTGGRFIHNNNDLAEGLRRLGAVPEFLYVLGFVPSDAVRNGKYHELKVRLIGGRHGSVEARMGYYAPTKEPADDSARRGERDRILTGGESPDDVAARVAAEPGSSDTGPRVVTKAWIDVSRLNFGNKKDRRTQRLTVIAALFDAAGNFVVGRQAEAELALKNGSFEALSAAGLTVSLSLHAASGSYRLRVLVEEGLTGKRTAVGRALELH